MVRTSALALAGSPRNYLAVESGTILVNREDRIPPDVIRLVPPIPMEEADELAARIKEGEKYDALGIVSTDVTSKGPLEARWFMRR